MSLIARFPDSPFAYGARRKLADLYAGQFAGADQRRGLGALAEGPRDRGWRVEVRRTPSPPAADVADFRDNVSDRVFFAAGSAALGARAHSVLRKQAAWLVSRPGIVVTIEGHADDPGSLADNAELSERRAAAVRQVLIEQGVAAERVKLAARGRSAPVAACRETACAVQNRRAVTRLSQSPGGRTHTHGRVR